MTEVTCHDAIISVMSETFIHRRKAYSASATGSILCIPVIEHL